MRITYGILAYFIFYLFCEFLISKGMKVSDDAMFIGLTIIIAGAMAGGD